MSATELAVAVLFISRVGLDLRSISKGGSSWRAELVYGLLFSALAAVLFFAEPYDPFGLASVVMALVSFGLCGLKRYRLRRSTTNGT